MRKIPALLPFIAIAFALTTAQSCRKADVLGKTKFVMGADLSYVNQILDHGGVYRENGAVKDPYLLFRDHGANLVRLRIWHNPVWTAEVYGTPGGKIYNGFDDVRNAIRRSKEAGLAVNLDFHYSDTWADPANQKVPTAWKYLDYNTLCDSVYRYTYSVLKSLDESGLMPEMVQIGNEINPGFLLPVGSHTAFGWKQLGGLLNSGIRAVREVSAASDTKTQIILHIAQPENVREFFGNLTRWGEVTDFDVVGFSYYSKWSDIPIGKISWYVSEFKKAYGKEVMIVETAYPWTDADADTYNNIFSPADSIPGYPLTPEGQLRFLTDLTQAVRDGGGMGIMVWEPAWITSAVKDPWGTGSSWDNCTFFDFDGNLHTGIDFMSAW
jgi:arabinogalactan endo-1,4-beta-galactosidase